MNKLPANAVARVCSATLNYRLNKSFVFQLKKSKDAPLRYLALCVAVLLTSSLLQALLGSALPWLNATVLKAIIDTVLYFINYRIQKAWVFPSAE